MSRTKSVANVRRHFFGIDFTRAGSFNDAMGIIQGVDPSEIRDFRYVVTPNADHIIRLVENPLLRSIYNNAWLCLNDSRVVQLLLRMGGYELPAIRGSDLAIGLLGSQWMCGKRLIVIGGDERITRWLNSLSGPCAIFHYNPPMGFISSRPSFDEVIAFIEQHLPAVVFLAVGSPSQELVADACRRRDLRGGVAFCVGAGILMAAGIEKRAPLALRFAGLEWLYRLARDPRRLSVRYLRDLDVLRIVAKEVLQEPARTSAHGRGGSLTGSGSS
jgi:exopolysaccharide biosynthesis WecB/TagA/CpsF family protein